MEKPQLLKVDKNGLLYLDDQDIEKNVLNLENRRFDCTLVSTFYEIKGVTDYIIKVDYQNILFHDYRTKKMIEEFQKRIEDLLNVDLPIAYYQKNRKVLGTVIPFYPNSCSLKEVSKSSAQYVMKYYQHDENALRNVLCLYMDVLSLLEEMFSLNMGYMDIRTGNFLVFQNKIKVIDFEPSEIHFKRINHYYHEIINRYLQMINYFSRSIQAKELIISKANSFDDVRDNIKRLSKKI